MTFVEFQITDKIHAVENAKADRAALVANARESEKAMKEFKTAMDNLRCETRERGCVGAVGGRGEKGNEVELCVWGGGAGAKFAMVSGADFGPHKHTDHTG